jgi:hypothetical protein
VKPFPPTPIPAIFSLSLGGLCPNPAITFEGRIVIPAVAVTAAPKNFLRDTIVFLPVLIMKFIWLQNRKNIRLYLHFNFFEFPVCNSQTLTKQIIVNIEKCLTFFKITLFIT